MRLENKPQLDGLCGEYLLGTLRGHARRRFERALREEPQVSLRLRYWQDVFIPRYTTMAEMQPSPQSWRRLEHELNLARYRTPWGRRIGVWRGLAITATAALVLSVALQLLRPAGIEPAPSATPIAQLEGKAEVARVVAGLTHDRATLVLHAARPVLAGPAQSYELWLIPVEGGAPLSLAVLGNLDARVPVAPAHSKRLVPGAKLAISIEPAGGSPTGGPTGPVIVSGQIGA
jgi:anti-sigma-K factor RskA